MYIHKEKVPMINSEEDLKEHLSELYVIHPYTESYDRYVEFQEKMYDIVKGCFHVGELRKYPIQFKFYPRDTKIYTLEIRHFIVHVFMWYGLISLHDVDKIFDENCVIDCKTEAKHIENFINREIIRKLKFYNIKETILNEDVSIILYNLRRISLDFSITMNLQFSFWDFLDAYNNNPRIKEIMECTFPPDMPLNEVEDTVSKYQKEIIREFIGMEGNPVGAVLSAETGVKEKQFGEYTVAHSLKPNLAGQVIPEVIESSTLIRGLHKPSYYYIGAGTSRKSLIMNKKVMGKAGHFGKIVLMLARTLSLSKKVYNCQTKHYVTYDITNKRILEKLNDKFYWDESIGDLKILNAEKDTDLIGKKLKFRSAATCACGDTVCAVCFGKTAALNFDIADGVAGYESEEITKVVNQAILSAKHLLTTKSEIITFNDDFYKFFTLSIGDVYPNLNTTDVESIDDYAIYIPDESMLKTDDMDDDSRYNNYIKNGMFYVVHMKTGEMIKIQLENDKEMYPTEFLLRARKKGKGYIKFRDLSEDVHLFEMSVLNDELTKPLYDLMHLINRSKTDDRYATIDKMSQKFVELLCDSGIDASAIAAECIINRLIRSVENPYERPDFTNSNLEEYVIYEVNKALEHNKSPMVGLAFQYIQRQLLSDEMVSTRDGSSYIDNFVKPKISNLYKEKKKRANLKK